MSVNLWFQRFPGIWEKIWGSFIQYLYHPSRLYWPLNPNLSINECLTKRTSAQERTWDDCTKTCLGFCLAICLRIWHANYLVINFLSDEILWWFMAHDLLVKTTINLWQIEYICENRSNMAEELNRIYKASIISGAIYYSKWMIDVDKI